MTKWGKFLKFLGVIRADDLDWVLYRVKDFAADKRNWETRWAEQPNVEEWSAAALDQVRSLRLDFKRTRLARIHGWRLNVRLYPGKPEWIQIWLTSPVVDARIHYPMWRYDYDAFLRACNGHGGLNLDEMNWLLERLTKTAVEKGK